MISSRGPSQLSDKHGGDSRGANEKGNGGAFKTLGDRAGESWARDCLHAGSKDLQRAPKA
jgi:hypothetical protein